MIKGKTKIMSLGASKYFLIPSGVFNDSTFPFSDDKLTIEIKGKKIMIEVNE